jgi:hypothetical protein
MALKQRVIIYTIEHCNRTAECNFIVSEATVHHWRHDQSSAFLLKSTIKNFTGPKKGVHPNVEPTVLHFIKDTLVKELPITQEAVQL